MPGFCTPWPGKSNAIGPVRSITGSPLHPGHQARPPRQPRAEAGEQDVVATLDASLADCFLQSQWNRGAGGVAVLVDVDRDALQGETDAPRCGIDDAEVGLVWNPEVDVVQRDARCAADLVRLADEDVDCELEHVGADHLDEWRRVLCRIRSFLDVAAGDLGVAAPVRAQAPAPEAGARRSRPDHRRSGAVAEDHRRPAI